MVGMDWTENGIILKIGVGPMNVSQIETLYPGEGVIIHLLIVYR